jgi:hypothetical protein
MGITKVIDGLEGYLKLERKIKRLEKKNKVLNRVIQSAIDVANFTPYSNSSAGELLRKVIIILEEQK